MPKPTRTAEQLQALLLERTERNPDLADRLTDVHYGGVRCMDPGEGGLNWTVLALTARTMHRTDIARIIRDVQMLADLEE